MRLSGPLRSTTAFCLLALLGVLGTGLPSHHHDDGGISEDGAKQWQLTADHHSHGTWLVEQDNRTPSGAPQVAVAASVAIDLTLPGETAVEAGDSDLIRPRERAPPPGAPRAPPTH